MGKQFCVVACVLVCVLGLAGVGRALPIPLPDSDDFGTDGTPPPGWTNIAHSWSASGGVAVPQLATYSTTIMKRGTYEYDSLNRLCASWSVRPDHYGDGSGSTYVELLTPSGVNPVGGGNGGVGYYVWINKSGTLRLYRDYRQWDSPGTIVGSAALGTSYNSSMHDYMFEAVVTGGTTAELKVYVDGVEKISYTDTMFLPLYGWTASGGSTANEKGPYTLYNVGVGRGHWPGQTTSNPQFDNWLLDQPVELPVPEPAGLSLLGLALLGLRRRRS